MNDFIVDIYILDPTNNITFDEIREAFDRLNLITLVIDDHFQIGGENITLPNNRTILNLAEEISNE